MYNIFNANGYNIGSGNGYPTLDLARQFAALDSQFAHAGIECETHDEGEQGNCPFCKVKADN